MNLLSLLRAKEPASAEIRRELAGLDIPSKATTITNIRAQRREMLIAGELDFARIDRELQEATIEHERAVVLDEELRQRLAQAEQREAVDALMARKAAAEKASREAARDMETKFPKLCTELVELRDRTAAAHAECLRVDEALAQLGTTERTVRTDPNLDQATRYNESVVARLSAA